MDNQRNLILAVVLSLALFLGWEFVVNRYFPEAVVAEAPVAPSAGAAAPAAEHAAPVRNLASELARPGRIRIDAPEIVGSINPVGARIDDIDLKTHRQTVERDSGPIRLFAPSGTADQQFAQFGWTGEGVKLPDGRTPWQLVEGEKLTQQTPVELGWDNGEGVQFRLRYAIDDHYMITVEQTVANTGTAAIALTPYAYVNRTSTTASKSTYNVHSGPISAVDDAVEFGTDYDEVAEAEAGTITNAGRTNWVGFTDIYWMSALIPDNAQAATSAFRSVGNDLYRADLYYAPVTIAPGKAVTRSTRLFAGAKEGSVLEAYADGGVTGFGNAIDWGWFSFIIWPIRQVLLFLFGLTQNFGVAIIGLTMIVRGLMFPVAQKQFHSMAKLRVVQPKMKALQERYKDDKEKLQQEMGKLYKDEGVNPLAGCLPIFLQIPIFFALYKSLLLSIEMRHEPFIAWIRDLSAPDPAHILNLFGMLDFTPPGFLAIGPMAVLLGLTMYLQFKLNPAATDPMQQQIFSIMPWVLMFVMAPFAAGLLLYWITSNILTLAQQRYLYARNPQLRAQAEKDAADKAHAAEREQQAKG